MMKTFVRFTLAASFLFQSVSAFTQEVGGGKRLYHAYCTGCHGSGGKGDGPAGKTLPVKPADHTNAKKMDQLTDDHLFTVITKGGAASGKSSYMPAWGGVLKENQIQEIIVYIRGLSRAGNNSEKGVPKGRQGGN
jgi:cytochrome c oxidase cbb3-type subunit 3